jgi:hypothetical protein
MDPDALRAMHEQFFNIIADAQTITIINTSLTCCLAVRCGASAHQKSYIGIQWRLPGNLLC